MISVFIRKFYQLFPSFPWLWINHRYFIDFDYSSHLVFVLMTVWFSINHFQVSLAMIQYLILIHLSYPYKCTFSWLLACFSHSTIKNHHLYSIFYITFEDRIADFINRGIFVFQFNPQRQEFLFSFLCEKFRIVILWRILRWRNCTPYFFFLHICYCWYKIIMAYNWNILNISFFNFALF